MKLASTRMPRMRSDKYIKKELMPFLDLGHSGDRIRDSIAYTIQKNACSRLPVKDES